MLFQCLDCENGRKSPCLPFDSIFKLHGELNVSDSHVALFSSLFDRVFCKIDIIRPENVYI